MTQTSRADSSRTQLTSRRRLDDEDGSIAILMMVILVGAMLSAMLVPMVIGQNRTTRYDSTRVQAVDAAQAGTDAFLGRIRAAVTQYGTVTGVVYTDSTKLPCAISGFANGTEPGSNPATYAVTAVYYTQAGKEMNCSPTLGLDTASGVYAASRVLIHSTGSPGTSVIGSSADRTLDTTYVFKTKTTTPGGLIVLGSDTTLCVDAGSAPPVAGSSAVIGICSGNPPAAQQQFYYRTDLTLQLPSSISTIYPRGLCLDTNASAIKDPIRLNPCLALGGPAYRQQWSYDEFGRFQATLATSSSGPGTLAGTCIDPAAGSTGQPLILASCIGGAPSPQAWSPTASVGRGAAALPQWANYGEFSRCITVPQKIIGSSHLWSYPCTQSPYSGAPDWSQLLQSPAIPATQMSAPGEIFTNNTDNGLKYCLTSPGISGGYPTMQACGGGNQQWRIYGGTVLLPTTPSLPYSTMYQIVDTANNLCLGLTAPFGTDAWSAIDVEACTGAADQKWNADPNVLIPSSRTTTER